MPIGIYSGTYTTPITLRSIYNPATVTGTGVINVNTPVSFTPGILGSAGAPSPWTLTNSGTVQSIGNLGLGVDLLSAGTVTNSGGLIQGTGGGVQIQGAVGTVANYGTIKGTGTASDGVRLMSGGLVRNVQSGTSVGFIQGSVNGVEIDGAIGSVTNSGSISGGVYLTAGGRVTHA